MAYSNETLKKYMDMAHDKMHFYMNISVDEIKECISSGNKKIGRVMNVSMLAIETCGHCSKCAGFCYDIKANFAYPSVLDARVRNTILAKYHRPEYFARIRAKLARRKKNKYFRWHVAGDILDYEYFAEMVSIAREYPDFTFWTYTKEYDIVNRYVMLNGFSMTAAIPSNLHVMFSKWDGQEMDNKFGFPVFACKLKNGNVDTTDDEFAKMFLCPGNCDVCKENHCGCIAGMNTYADEH